jgi:hypothetical protein
MGVISFCAYNTGIGWRQIVEKKQVTPDERQHHEEMARLYRQHVLKGDPSMISVGMLKATVKQLRLAPTSSSPAPSSPAAARADTPPSRC